jgi:hypothetical protein
VRRPYFFAAVAASALLIPSAADAVVVMPGYDLDAGTLRNGHVGIGLLVPDAGPTTSEQRARASLERGRVRNSLHGELPEGPTLIRVREATPASRVRTDGALVGIPAGGEQPNDRRYLFLLHGPPGGGVIVSPTTRIPGLVSAVDVAPWALGREGALSVEAHSDPVGYLRDLDDRIRDNGRARGPAGAAVLAVVLVLAFALPRAAVLAFSTAALANLLLGAAGVSEPWLTVTAIGLGALAAVPLALVLRSALGVGLVLAGTLLAYLVAMAADATWVALSPLGPTQNARFYGLSNLLATMLLVPALAGAALLTRRWGAAALVAVGALAVVTVGSSRLGADGGGAVVLATGLAVLGAALAGGRGRAWVAAAAGAAAALALVALDALVGPSTHVGRSVRGGPAEVLADVGDRLVLSWERVTAGPAVALAVVAALTLAAVLLAREWRRPLPLAFGAALAVSLLVNDSPLEVAVGGAAGLLALTRYAGEVELPRYNPAR